MCGYCNEMEELQRELAFYQQEQDRIISSGAPELPEINEEIDRLERKIEEYDSWCGGRADACWNQMKRKKRCKMKPKDRAPENISTKGWWL